MRLFRCYNPEGADGNGTVDGEGANADVNLQDALTAELGGAPEVKQVEKTPETKAEVKEGSAQVVNDDPEFDIEEGKDEEGKPKTKKLKLSELKKGYMLQSDYTKKTQEIAKSREELKAMGEFAQALRGDPEFGKLIVGIVEKAITKEGYNKDFITKAAGILQDKIEAKQEQLEAKDDEIERMLEGLDDDNPIAIALKKTSKINATMANQLKALQSKLDAIENSSKEEKTRTQQAADQAEVGKIREVFRTTLDKMADPKDPKAFKFVNDKQKERWRRGVAEEMTRRTEQGDVGDFNAMLTETAKQVYELLNAEREEYIAEYLKSKKPVENVPKKEEVKTENEGLMAELERELLAAQTKG